jgi:hypothetical protein
VETRVEIAQGKVSRPHEQHFCFHHPAPISSCSRSSLSPFWRRALEVPPVVSITGAGRFQEPPAPPTALGVVVSSDEFQPT